MTLRNFGKRYTITSVMAKKIKVVLFAPIICGICAKKIKIASALTKPLLQQLLNNLFEQVPQGSAIVFDYADEQLFETKGIYERVAHMVQLAAASGEPMHCALSLPELITMLEESELGLYEHLAPEDIQQRYFAHRTDNLQAFETIHYVHAVKMHDA